MEVNEEKRKKFIEYAGKRVNNVLHGIQILEPMSRSSAYDFTKQDVEEMFGAMQETLNNTRAEFERKFEEKSRSEKKTFSFGTNQSSTTSSSWSSTTASSSDITTTDTTTSTNDSTTTTSDTSSVTTTLTE